MRVSDLSSDVCSSDLNPTPADEILRGFDDLVRQGKILYIGVSDTPAWQIARLQTMAELRGWTQLVALQAEYSLLQRTTESDLIPAADALGIGVMPWSPLASGLLSGKYADGAQKSSVPAGGRGERITAERTGTQVWQRTEKGKEGGE